MSKPKNMFNKMNMMRKVLEADLDGNKKGLRSCNKDKVIAVTGAEGLGKSNVVQVMFDIWYKDILKDENYSAEYIKFFGSNKEEFLCALKECTDHNLKYMMVAHDEAAKDLYSRKAMSAFSSDMNIAYQVIRGLNLYTILIIPSVLDLDSFFRKRRLSGMIHVFNIDYKNSETQFAYYTKKRLDNLIPEMSRLAERNSNPDPFKCDTKPLFYDTAELYSGTIKEAYDKRKRDNMKGTVDELYGKHSEKAKEAEKEENKATPQTALYKNSAKDYISACLEGLNQKEVADKFYVSMRTVSQGVHYYLNEFLNKDESMKLRKKLTEARKERTKYKKAAKK